jgi:uncharacterized protein (UPF0218 family)
VQISLLTDDLAKELKAPLGQLVPNEKRKTSPVIKNLSKCCLIVSVGDATLDFLLSMNLVPDIQVIDSKERRENRLPPRAAHKSTLHTKNPKGTISEECIGIFLSALSSPKPVRIIVKGEEDLLTLIAITSSPEGSCVLYGQPMEGLVVVRVEKKIRARCKKIFHSMLEWDLDKT